MNLLEEIKLDFSQIGVKKEEIFQYFGYGKQCPNDYILKVLDSFMKEAENICKPIFGYRILKGREIDKYRLEIEREEFNPGGVITRALKGCEHYILLVSTVGKDFTEWLEGQHNSGDIINLYVSDALGSAIAEATSLYGYSYLEKMAESEGLSVTSPYSPGYCDWHVKEQKKFFSLLPKHFCGVTLNDSSLMSPIKSTNCVIGLDKNAIKRPYGCAICKKNDCFLKIARAHNFTL